MRVDFPHLEARNERAFNEQLAALQDLMASVLRLLKGQP
jgi:hypothetical protein